MTNCDEVICNNKTKTPIVITRIQKKSLTALELSPSTFMCETNGILKPTAPRVLDSSLYEYSSSKSELTDYSTMSWRRNVEKLFETVEFQRTKSYRTPSTNSNNNLFDQLLSSKETGERKNSMAKMKANALAKDSVLPQPNMTLPKQSNATQKSSILQKRTSIISLQNN